MTHDHLTEDQCIALTLDDEALPTEAARCSVCAARHQQIADTLLEVAGMAEAMTDATFPPEKLARQRTRILQRIEHYGRQARILAFPVRHVRRPSMLRPPSVRRWIAGAAAAGLVIGMVAGHMAHEIHPFALSAAQEARTADIVPLRASSDVLGDNELLRSIQAAVDTNGPSALRRIADVTPDAWDVQ